MVFSILVFLCCIHYVGGMGERGHGWDVDKELLHQCKHHNNVMLNSQYGHNELAVKGRQWLQGAVLGTSYKFVHFKKA